MSSRGSYSQKKKKEAVRRLGQQHSHHSSRAGPSSGLHDAERRSRSLEKRRRSDEDPDHSDRLRKRASSSGTSLFGQDSSSGSAPSGLFDSDSSIEDVAGTGRTVEVQDAPLSNRRRVIFRNSASKETRTGGSFGHKSPLNNEGVFQQSRRTSLKRDLSPSKPSSVSQHPVTSHDVFGSYISDMESFGSAPSKPKIEKENMQGRASVKRSGLFGRAIEDASGHTETDSKKQRNQETSPKDSLRKETSIKHKNTIIVKDVPDELNNQIYINDFFSKFGKVKKVLVNPGKTMATVYFKDHKSAAKAKHHVKTLDGTRQVKISWTHKHKLKKRRKSDENVPPSTIEIKRDTELVQKTGKPPPPPHSSVIGRSIKGYHTASERYEALEERDKQSRKGLTKQSDLATAKKMTGTCPDMCPEKERYMREVQRRLSLYEILPGDKIEKGENPHVCHERAVKEYSRSSADQEEPLPSELRPPAVLDLTMNYLIREIMNRDPRSWAGWFDFLWNRTRSIRKEITQQQLCGTTAVSLMEKCARFHIYCSYRLCEEDHMAFDPKINNENLTKCLQSLKQFYHDLADEGVVCPNEAEFRAYEVLLNLTGGDILREVQQYRPEVRDSEAVVFAIKVSAAFSSNNYCRFFKLIRVASFLNACILHRYFVQLRCLALETMNKAFTTPKGTSMFPTAELVHLLAFEDDEQVSKFCECHGLSNADGCIQLSRGGFIYPEEAITSQRAPSVIEAKNVQSVGEVVNNGPLPFAPPHTPISSFDVNGRLLDRGVEDKTGQEMAQPERKIEKAALQERLPIKQVIQFQ